MSSTEPRRPRAGIAFIDAVAGDPAAEAALERARDRLRLFAKATEPLRACRAIVAEAMEAMTAELGRIHREADAERAEALRLVAEIIRGALDDANAQLSARGFDAPGRDLEAWERLARIVEREPSNMTLAEIFDWAIVWSDREKLRARIAATTLAETGPEGEEALLRRLRAQINSSTRLPAPPDAGAEQLDDDADIQRSPPPAMKPSVRLAGASFERVEREHPDLSPPPGSSKRYCEVQWAYIRDHYEDLYPLNPKGRSTIPVYASWERYVREYLRLTEGPTNSDRAGRRRGRSIVTPDDIDRPHRGDD